jgi:hypothetical protein
VGVDGVKPERISTFDAVWGLKKVFYHIERFRLPIPVSLSELLIVVLLEAFFIIMSNNFAWMSVIPPVFRFAIIPFGTAWLLSRVDLEGRPPYQYLWSSVTHSLSNKLWSRGVPIPDITEEATYHLTKMAGGIKHYATDTDRD